MNSPSRHNSALEEQAALWAARLDGDVLDADQRAALDAWLAESPAHRALLSQYCQFSADLEENVQALRSMGAASVSTETTVKRRKRWSFPTMAAVTLAAAAALTLAVWVVLPKSNVENVVAGIAQRASHTLADGTRVELNAHTSLRFENSKTERRVRLTGGEALFAVAKDFSRPFIVETPNGSVRVTGTTFNVRTDSANTVALEVTVIEGSVEVRPSGVAAADRAGPFSLIRGDQLSAGGHGVKMRQLSPSAVDDVLAWREGQIVFEDVPLHEVAARLARYHGKRITVAPEIAGIGVGGRYGLDDLDAFKAALEAALPVKVSHDQSGAVSIVPRTGSQ